MKTDTQKLFPTTHRLDSMHWVPAGALLMAAALLLPITLPSVHAAVTEAWVHHYNNVVTNANDQAVKVVRDAAGDFIVTGTTDDGVVGSDILTIKYSGADGSVLWQQRYDGSDNVEDIPSALAVDGNGNVVVSGRAGDSGGARIYTAKYAGADGTLLWEQLGFGGAWAVALAVDGNGNVVVAGNGITDYYTAKYAAADGTLLWERLYTGPDPVYNLESFATAVAVDASGNVIVTGASRDANIFNWHFDYYTVKYAAADGALLWEKRYNGPANGHDNARAVAVDTNGNVVVTGVSFSSSYLGDFYTAKYAAANGALIWEKRNAGLYEEDGATALALDASGNAVVTGKSGGDYYTAKYAAANGALRWEKRQDDPLGSVNVAPAVAVDTSGNVVVTGTANNGLTFHSDFCTAKYAAANGALLWEKHYDGPVGGVDEAKSVAVDAGGNVVVTGRSQNGLFGDSEFDFYTAKYAAANGVLLWQQRYAGVANNADEPAAVAVDSGGNVVVAGYSSNSHGSDYYTAKYATANGALLWEKRYLGVGQGENRARALALDASGNVLVTGYDYNPGNFTGTNSIPANDDFYTAKYAAADGALLWERRYDSPAHGLDDAAAVAVDRNGDVVVAGSSRPNIGADELYVAKYAGGGGALLWEQRNAVALSVAPYWLGSGSLALDPSGNVVIAGTSWAGGYDYYTVKYAATNGALLWERSYNSPANDIDAVAGVAVDSSGNVVVTGFSRNSAGAEDFLTVKYSGANGVPMWAKRYHGPNIYSLDHPTAVAVDASGNVVVTGYSQNTNYTETYYTANYAAADGALLWEQRGPGGRAVAVAVNAVGNVVVTGTSGGDYYTAKYAAANGVLLWEKRYNGSAYRNSVAATLRSLALGPNGMVAITGTSDLSFGPYAALDFTTIVYRDLPLISIERVPDGVRLRCFGDPGRVHQLWRSQTVTGRGSLIHQQSMPGAGLFEFTDTAGPPDAAFYHVETLP